MNTPVPVEKQIIVDGKKFCYCNHHQDFLDCNLFNKNANAPHGFNYSCKECIYTIKLNRDLYPRFKIQDGVDLCWCSRHKEYHPCTEFTQSEKIGYQYNCAEINKSYSRDRYLGIGNPRDTQITQELLSLIGYVTNTELTIHEQFLIKHNL